VLTEWKQKAQQRAFRDLVAPRETASSDEAARIGPIVEKDNAADPEFGVLFSKVRGAAASDLEAYMRGPIWSSAPVELTLRLYDDFKTPPFSIAKLPLAIEVAPEITIISPPGTGKTTTLLQLAAQVLSANSIVPLYFRLGDWSAGSSSLLASLQQRPAFKGVQEDDLYALAQRGRILLLLDGWNELDTAARRRLRIELDQIRRNWPFVRLVTTTRRQMLDVPLSGPRVLIEPLSYDQQMAIARAQFRAQGERMVDDAWRTPGVRELIAIPLYLSALLGGGTQDQSASTKEELLRLFVEQHERATDHAETLHATLFGCHTEILTALASRLNSSDSTAMTEAEAREIIAATVAQLRERGQIVGQPEPSAVLDVLTSHHTLLRSGSNTIAFQHQQFQEWYASHEVIGLMRAAATGDAGPQVRLRASVFDQPPWEESIYFAVERLSREPGGAAVVAHAVRLALPIDPMLAAEMIYRSSLAVWANVSADIAAFVNRWHRPGRVDRAVRFMIMTGRPEFEPLIWPLASSTDTQTQLPTLRIAPRFRPAVLGSDIRTKISALPEPTREHLLSLIASESGVDGMDLATELAQADPSPKVQAHVVQNLQFRRADRHVAQLLSKAHDETWVLVAKRGYAEEIRDPATTKRLQEEREKALDRATEPLERLRLLLEQSPSHPERDAGITAAIADPKFPIREPGGSSLYDAQERALGAVLRGLRQRLEAGLPLPFHADDLLKQLDTIDDGPIATAILDVSKDAYQLNATAIIAGPKTVGILIDRFVASALALKTQQNDPKLSEEHHRLRARISATRESSFLSALTERTKTEDPTAIRALSTLAAGQGDDDNRKVPLRLDSAAKTTMMDVLRHWTDIIIKSPTAERYDLSEVSNAIGRFGFPELVPDLKRLLDEDLSRRQAAITQRMNALNRGDRRVNSDAAMGYGNQYREAFVRLGGDEAVKVLGTYLEDRTFGLDAALALKAISDQRLGIAPPNAFRRWPDFAEVALARSARAATGERTLANALAEPIFSAIDRLAQPETDEKGQFLAIALAWVALAMPHANRDDLVARVVKLPQPLGTKRQLFAAMALDGQVLDAEVIMRAIEEWLTDAQRDAWQKRQHTWEIEPWLELLPFSTRPESVLEGLTKVKEFYGTGWAKRWERVLAAVAAIPGPQGDALLASLARTHTDIVDDYGWTNAFLGRNTASSVLLYVDLCIESVFGQGPRATGTFHLGQRLAACVQNFPEIRPEIQKRYERAGPGNARAMLEHLLREAATEDDLIIMVKKYVAEGRAYDGGMAGAVRGAALRRVPVSEGSNSFYIQPVAIPRARKFLFGLLGGSSQEATLARNSLSAIDELRDDHGIAANDTRHPDVMSEIPWPPEAGLN
jgi:hypothetical protein